MRKKYAVFVCIIYIYSRFPHVLLYFSSYYWYIIFCTTLEKLEKQLFWTELKKQDQLQTKHPTIVINRSLQKKKNKKINK